MDDSDHGLKRVEHGTKRFMKQPLQTRVSPARIEAIRRKRKQGWTLRQIEEGTGIDHVTVWRHTRFIKPERAAESDPDKLLLTPVSLPTPVLISPSESHVVPATLDFTLQGTPPTQQSQSIKAKTAAQLAGPRIDIPRYRTIEETDDEDPLDRFWREEDGRLVREARRVDLELMVEERKKELWMLEARPEESRINREKGVSTESGSLAAEAVRLLWLQFGMDLAKFRELAKTVNWGSLAKVDLLRALMSR